MPEFNSLREKIRFEKEEREQKYSQYESWIQEAHAAGVLAVQNLNVIPMVVSEHESPLDDSSPVKKSWFVPDGVCGFAWVTVRPGNSSFATFVKKNFGWRKAYEGGVQLWISDYGQSMQKKSAYAYAYAEVLQKHGINGICRGENGLTAPKQGGKPSCTLCKGKGYYFRNKRKHGKKIPTSIICRCVND